MWLGWGRALVPGGGPRPRLFLTACAAPLRKMLQVTGSCRAATVTTSDRIAVLMNSVVIISVNKRLVPVVQK